MNLKIDRTIPIAISALSSAITFAVSSAATGQNGAAKTTKALSNLGIGNSGMKGGIVTLGVEALSVDKATEFFISQLFIKSINKMLLNGEDETLIMNRINQFPISQNLKSRLREIVYLQNKELPYAK